MNFNTLICPTCHQRITVSENAPQHLVCPKCLTLINNPQGRPVGAGPKPVLPIEVQVSRDSTAAIVILVVTMLSLALGIGLIKIQGSPFGILFILAALMTLAGYRLFQKYYLRDKSNGRALGSMGPTDSPRTLNYARPEPGSAPIETVVGCFGQAAMGILVAAVVCVGLVFLLLITLCGNFRG